MKRCAKCGEVKPEGEFNKRQAYCRECSQQVWRKNLEKMTTCTSCKTNPPTKNGRCKECNRNYRMKKKYTHLTALSIQYLFEVNDNKCYICGADAETVDWDEHREMFRGALCYRCNKAIRVFYDIDKLLKAVRYLERIKGVIKYG